MENKAWVISVNMGYGHQRTAFPLRRLTPEGKWISANDYEGIPGKDRKIWETTRKFYEAVSRFSRVPLVGKAVFAAYDRFQRILEFYPKRTLVKPNFALKQLYSLLKRGWGKHLIDELKVKSLKLKVDLPIISTFFTPAFMAETFEYPGEIYCVVCDADISRVWAPLNPKKSRIKYLTPTQRAAERLWLYGVAAKNVFLTGYPLPLENIGSQEAETLKEDLKNRLLNLDTEGEYYEKHRPLIEANLGKLPEVPDHPLTLLFSVGGAGAQKEIGAKILKSLRFELFEGRIKIILSCGIREEVKAYFEQEIRKLKLKRENIGFICERDIESYFEKFNSALHKTDILWTKPSELSFYAALGIPIIIAPPIGSQEEFNMRWLVKSNFGILQENPAFANQWLFDRVKSGHLAESALEGFIEGENQGTYNIEKILA